MNISSAASSVSQLYSAESNSSGNSEIKDLEEKKSQLEQKMEDERNPFATRQSDEYEHLKKQNEEIEQQIQQKKAKASRKTDSVSSASPNQKVKNGEGTPTSARSPFDHYEHEENQLVTGTYGDTFDEDGKRTLY